jgi:hypothetical protein
MRTSFNRLTIVLCTRIMGDSRASNSSKFYNDREIRVNTKWKDNRVIYVNIERIIRSLMLR